jgi:hypothetical protein
MADVTRQVFDSEGIFIGTVVRRARPNAEGHRIFARRASEARAVGFASTAHAAAYLRDSAAPAAVSRAEEPCAHCGAEYRNRTRHHVIGCRIPIAELLR